MMIMKPGILHIVLRSIKYYRKPVLYQFAIITLLSAIITGSLLTGSSVKHSLIRSAEVKLGNTGLIISSGVRYFSPDLASAFNLNTGIRCTPVLESSGFCRNLKTGIKSLNINIYGVTDEFFSFNGYEKIHLNKGEAAINSALASRLKIVSGEEVIISFRQLSDIPSNSPFAPSTENTSLVLKAGIILPPESCGNFSLGISQLTPENVFINLNDIANGTGLKEKVNRILLESTANISVERTLENFKGILVPENAGLILRKIRATNETEIISSRIFIDQVIFDEIKKIIPSSRPVLSYLANSVSLKNRSTPYSFVSALDTSEQKIIPCGNKIVLNRWLAEDLNASVNDSVTLSWFEPGRISDLKERSERFEVSKIVDQQGIFSDSLLMPEFPGIAGRESCSDWDAGVKIRMDRIRKKDESYWSQFKGTPKAFVCYEKGKAIWGNNFGPVTAIRFPSELKIEEIVLKLKGNLDPEKFGFTVKNLKTDMIRAANESVDFTTLFISLGFFIILSCVILLLLNVTAFLDSRKKQISALFAIGFKNSWINRLIFLETGFIALVASFTGAIFGVFINWLIISGLNSVWIGAVQTDTLTVFSDPVSIMVGFSISFFLTLVFLYIKVRKYSEKIKSIKTGVRSVASFKTNFVLFTIFLFISFSLLILLFISGDNSTPVSFAAGVSAFITLMLLWRQYAIGGFSFRKKKLSSVRNLSGKFFSFYPSRALAPVLFISAGLFAVIITGMNRLEINERNLGASGGTGGYLLWAETVIPVKEDLNSLTGRKNFGLDESPASGLTFMQARRTSGDDARCLNLNHVTSPPLLGIDPAPLIKNRLFSFASLLPQADKSNPWKILTKPPEDNVIYGIADQTVLDWGLKIKTGDTLMIKTESGQVLHIVIAGGLKSSVFQGYLIISEENFKKFFPSISGNSVFLIEGKKELSDGYIDIINNRFENYGISVLQTSERLASFFKVTNTYLSVFNVLGALGMMLGVIGLGFVLIRNYNFRKQEFALLMATGFTDKRIKRMILTEQVLILMAGLLTGIISPVIATLPSIRSGSDMPWLSLTIISVFITLIGLLTLFNSVKSINQSSLITSLRRE
jgi:putative ABC transport system permease protein